MESSSALLELTERSPRPSGRERRPRTVTATEFCQALAVLNITQTRVARWFAVEPRCVRRWRDGSRRTPRGVDILFRLLLTQVLTIEQVETAAATILAAQTNGSGKPGLPAPRPVESALETLVDPSLATVTTAEKVYGLAAGSCRWPCGDPRRSDFYFCARPAVKGSYCEEHDAAAHMVLPIDNKHGAIVPARTAHLARQFVLKTKLLHV